MNRKQNLLLEDAVDDVLFDVKFGSGFIVSVVFVVVITVFGVVVGVVSSILRYHIHHSAIFYTIFMIRKSENEIHWYQEYF